MFFPYHEENTPTRQVTVTAQGLPKSGMRADKEQSSGGVTPHAKHRNISVVTSHIPSIIQAA